jgi:4-hydroxy-3-methylbut-2-enyl diphosphate reductase
VKVVLAQPRGFCAGVERAIDIVERALARFGAPVYVRHEIVHNKRVVNDLRDKGAIFVEDLSEIPTGAVTIFSAHGVSQMIEDEAGNRGLKVIDATCPLVAKVHKEGQRYSTSGRDVVLIGHKGHAEVEGTLGRIDGRVHLISEPEDVDKLDVENADRVAYVTQTTLSVDDTREVIEALRERFPKIAGPDVNDICYATQNRQQAVRELAKLVDVLLVIGASNSSNSNRLREIGEELNVPSYLIDDVHGLNPGWLDGVDRVGITAGASAPETLVTQLVDRLRELGATEVTELNGLVENVHFKLPIEVRDVDLPVVAARRDGHLMGKG